MPDSSIMLDLCDVLKITVNDLLSGEVVTMNNYNKKLESNLLDMIKQKEQSDKRLLTMEIVTGIICIIPLIAAEIVGLTIPMEDWIATIIMISGVAPILIATPFMIKIEQTAGYYKCARCGHIYIPKYSSVLWAPHVNRTRYMKCPKCNEKSWNKKVLTKE